MVTDERRQHVEGSFVAIVADIIVVDKRAALFPDTNVAHVLCFVLAKDHPKQSLFDD
jgi:hypothetical protein